jgi:hypothetical protein
MKASRLLIWSLAAIAAALIVGYAVQRDIRYDREYPLDLRNRVVGARLVKDGREPYFYKWRIKDGIRYYDHCNIGSATCSNITASPFFLHLLFPIADLPEATLSRYWLVFEYLILILNTCICLTVATTFAQKKTVLTCAVLFLLTNAWKQHVANGQMYLFIPLLASLFYMCARRKMAWVWGALAGLCAACLILTRINAVFLFLPFLLILPAYDRRWRIAFCVAPLALGGWTLLNSHERGLWLSYSRNIGDHIKADQRLPIPTQHNDPDPKYAHWEGVDVVAAQKITNAETDTIRSENGNIKTLYELVVGHRIPIPALMIICVGGVGAALLFFCLRNRPFTRISLEQAVLFGYALYMFSDFCSPVSRYQYPTVQWLFPLLLAAAILNGKQRAARWWLLAGLLMNILHIPYWKMRNTSGEYIFLAVLLVLSLIPGRLKASKPLGASVSPDPFRSF